MKIVSVELMPWHWIDPLRHLRHIISKCTFDAGHGPWQVTYGTWCRHNVSVDDINPKTCTISEPTCMQCLVAEPIINVLHDPE